MKKASIIGMCAGAFCAASLSFAGAAQAQSSSPLKNIDGMTGMTQGIALGGAPADESGMADMIKSFKAGKSANFIQHFDAGLACMRKIIGNQSPGSGGQQEQAYGKLVAQAANTCTAQGIKALGR